MGSALDDEKRRQVTVVDRYVRTQFDRSSKTDFSARAVTLEESAHTADETVAVRYRFIYRKSALGQLQRFRNPLDR